ncbi:hypothetical protein UVI_02034290 [Ustilaginoidea virens]|uniref:Major facilitator superfamily (MFS) profile domain-containing protein n=1 Tax=Ustilaginoidea virens TaxID=1159556 RepID=A0A1B5KTR2_USTVR|nr:hypothetical protein UVI_02034290 [Ustilaginoidea virens]
MPEHSEKAAPERQPDEIERPASPLSVDTAESEAVRDVEKALPDHAFPSADTSGEPAGAETDPGPAAAACRTMSRVSSTRSRAVTIVPRTQRRGLLSHFAITPEVERPFEYKNSTKWLITGTVAFATLAAPLGSAILYPSLHHLTIEFNTSSTVANLSVALYMLAMGIFPLWWSSFSEEFGRRSIYIISFIMFILSTVLCGLSQNMAMLIVFRCLTGGASASVLAVGAGTIADIWESFERGRSMSMYYLGPLLGPIVSPTLGGVLTEKLGWRACMYFLTVYGLVVTVLLVLFLPETLARKKTPPHPQADADADDDGDGDGDGDEAAARRGLQKVSTRQSAKRHSKRFAKQTKRFLVDPLAVLLLLRFPPVLITVCVASVAFGALFVVNISVQQTFAKPPYSFSEISVGLLYLPPALGYFITALFGGRWIDNIMAREARKANRYDARGKLVLLPEDRVRENMWIANTVYPCALLLFGWTLDRGIFWLVPSVGAFLFGLSYMLVFSVATTMLTELVSKRSSAGVAVNNFARSILSCAATVVAAPWIQGVGVGYVMTTAACFCMVAGYAGIWTLRRNAPRWRKEMDVALQSMT